MNRMIHRWLGFVLAAMLGLLVLVGCVPAASPAANSGGDGAAADTVAEDANAEAESAPAEKVKVVWWQGSLEDELRELVVDEFVTAFNDSHENIELEVVFQEDYARTTQTAVQAGAGPDLIQLGGPGYAIEYWRGNQILDLTPFADQYGWEEMLLPWAYESGKADQSLISIPFQYESLVLYVNTTVLDELGLEPPQNIEDIEAICEASEATERWCFSHFFARNRWYFSTIWESYAGADVYREATIQDRRWDDPLLVGAIQLEKDWVDRGWISRDLETYYSLTHADVLSNFAEGKAPLMINGTWVFRSLPDLFEESGQEWDWVMMPPLRNGVEPVYDLSIGESIAINAASPNPEAAAEVITWLLTNKELGLEIAAASNFSNWLIPWQLDADDLATVSTDQRVLRFLEDFAEKTGQGQTGYPTWTYWPPQAKTWAETEQAQVFNETMTPEEFMAAFQEEYAAEYAETSMPVPPEPSVESPD